MTPGAEEASLNHQIAVTKRLASSKLNDHYWLRSIEAPIEAGQASTLLEVTGAQAVVRGEVQAIADAGTFSATLTFSATSGEAQTVDSVKDENQRGKDQSSDAVHHDLPTELRLPLANLVDDPFEAEHVDALEATTFVLTAEILVSYGELDEASECLALAEPFCAALSERVRAHYELVRVFIHHRSDPKAAFTELRRVAKSGVDHPDIWGLIAWLAMTGAETGQIKPAVAVIATKDAVEADEDNSILIWMYGRALASASRYDDASEQFARIQDLEPFSSDPDFLTTSGAILFNLDRIDEAQVLYARAVKIRPNARRHLYLADTYVRQEDFEKSRFHYREALRFQSDLVDAHRGYWWKYPYGNPKRAAIDRISLGISRLRWIPNKLKVRLLAPVLRWHHKRHPEDTRIHFMLGANALLRKDFDVAEERLEFSYEVVGGADYQALARLAIVHAANGQYQDMRQAIQGVHDAPELNGRRPTVEELAIRVADLLAPMIEIPDLLTLESQAAFGKSLEVVFSDVAKHFDSVHE